LQESGVGGLVRMGIDPIWYGSNCVRTCLFGSGLNLRGSGGPGPGNPDSSRPFLGPDPPSLPVLVWLVLGWLGLLVPVVMVLALAVLVAVALVVLEMASLISFREQTRFSEELTVLTALAILSKPLQLAKLGMNLWRRRRLSAAFAEAQAALGERMYAAGIDDGELGAKITAVDEQLRRAETLGDSRKVIQMDDIVDHLNGEIITVLIQEMQQGANHVPGALSFFSAVRQLERIADHAVKIAEDVVYLVEGEMIHHKHGPTNADVKT
jgi:hypothetical protein